MEINAKEFFEKIYNSDKKTKIFVAVGIIGILLILLSEFVPSGSSVKKEKCTSYSEYVEELEHDTQDIIASINGVGKCKVMLTLKNTNESVYAKNLDENKNDGSYSTSNEYVFYDGENGDTPVLIKEYFPQIQGVVVVCQGADNSSVKEQVINSVSSLFNIPTSKISVSKLNE